MNIDTIKANISIQVANNTINTLIAELAAALVKNEELTAEIEKLKNPPIP